MEHGVNMTITIDGPVASGKSTVGRILANKLHFYYLNSGSLYRAIAYLLLHEYGYTLATVQNINSEDISRCVDSQRFSYDYNEQEKERVFFDKKNITFCLKDKTIDQASSIISVNPYVREVVTCIQRRIASSYDVVVDGRDVGSVVFPDAQVKFFLTASVAVRAQRWCKDQEKHGNHFSVEQAMELITDRDNRDKNRPIGALVVPKDAIMIDNSLLTIDQTVDEMTNYINNYL
jgi:CMP/dCMP kinase